MIGEFNLNYRAVFCQNSKDVHCIICIQYSCCIVFLVLVIITWWRHTLVKTISGQTIFTIVRAGAKVDAFSLYTITDLICLVK